MTVLAIDTSNKTLSIALCADGQLIGQYTGTTNKNHSLALMPAIDFVMKENKLTPKDLTRIVVAKGPGSYTGLRIGVTTAKTLAWTLGIDLVGVSSLASLAANAIDYQGYIVPLFDARRGNVYSGVYCWQDGELLTVVKDQHVSLASWLLELKSLTREIRFVGQDVVNFKESILAHYPATAMVADALVNEVNSLSLAKLGSRARPVTSVADFVPAYLKLVEAEENWLKTNQNSRESYVKKS